MRYPNALAPWRTTLGELIDAGADMRTLERVIDTAAVDGEGRAALWLWAWSRAEPTRARRRPRRRLRSLPDQRP
jgi:hypothetical protein